MTRCLFASDLHGKEERYRTLLAAAEAGRPSAVFLGGDLLPSGSSLGFSFDPGHRDFIDDFLVPEFLRLKSSLGEAYPRVLAILGNDDGRLEEAAMLAAATRGVWEYIQNRQVELLGHPVFGYAFVPPTPFLLKDWERYDVSRYVDPGSVSPEEGIRSVPVAADEARYATIQQDLERLAGQQDLSNAILLFHAPPYQSNLDRAALDGRSVEGVPLDLHVGSIAIRRFIEARQPLLALHGHVHESVRLTGSFKERIGRTWCLSAAHDGPELALVDFDLEDPGAATRETR